MSAVDGECSVPAELALAGGCGTAATGRGARLSHSCLRNELMKSGLGGSGWTSVNKQVLG